MTLTLKGLAPLTRIDTSLQESIDDLSVFLTPQMFAPVGATLGDGTSQPLSDFYASLAAAQVDFSFVTALTQETDWACLQKMSYEALGYPAFEHAETNSYLNKPMFIPGGNYVLGADTWLIRNASGIKITGAGRRSTKIFGSGIVFATDGLWYSQIEGIWFQTQGSPAAVVDIDGNVPGHPYATRGVQSNTFKDIGVDGGALATYGFALTRQGNPPGPGAQGSENLFLACVFVNCVQANWFSTGFNALQNTFIGGNFQGHQKHGIYIIGGSVYLFSVGFQSTYAYTQIINDGYDININSGGVGDRITIIGCRTESARFYRGAGSQPPILIGNLQGYGGDVGWTPLTASYYDVNDTIIKSAPTIGRQMYRVTTAGTSGGDTVTNSDIFSATTIGKTGKAWTVNQWIGWKVVLTGGTGGGQERNITSNTATTLTVPTWTTTPDATTDFWIEPIWPDSGTFTDGSVVWTRTSVFPIDVTDFGQFIGNAMQFGFIGSSTGVLSLLDHPTREITTSTLIHPSGDETVLIDATTGDLTVTLSTSGGIIGKQYFLKRTDNTVNVVTVEEDTGQGPDRLTTTIQPLGFLQVIRAVGMAGTVSGQNNFRVIARSDKQRIYRAVITQSGTSAPTAVVLENSLGGTVALARTGVGAYTLTLTGAFPANKIWISPANVTLISGNDASIARASSDVLTITTTADADLTDFPLEVLIYP